MNAPRRAPWEVLAVVAADGSIGAAARYRLEIAWPPAPARLSLGDLRHQRRRVPESALTTYSTFVFETVRLAQSGSRGYALANVVATLAAGLAAATLGWALAG